MSSYLPIKNNSSRLNAENEDLDLQPLIPSNQPLSDALSVNEQHRLRSQSFRSTLTSRMKIFHCKMSLRASRLCCFEILKFIPVLFLLAIIAWSYYAFVIQMCLYTVDNIPKRVIYIFIFHSLLILFLWSYYKTMFTPSTGPPKHFYVGDVEAERIVLAQSFDERRTTLFRLSRRLDLPVFTQHFDGSIRYCFACRCIKPDRAHHCSVCGKCTLRYDHHCPWTNSCISHSNYKFFVIFLGWALVLCLYVAGTSLEYFIQFWRDLSSSTITPAGRFHLLFLFFVSFMFAMSVASLFFYHLYLTGKNRTTIESFRAPIFSIGPQKDGFNIGFKRNFQEIFGKRIFHALLPIWTTQGDGVHYQMNSALLGGLGKRDEQNHDSSDIILPLEQTSTMKNDDRQYLLSEQKNN